MILTNFVIVGNGGTGLIDKVKDVPIKANDFVSLTRFAVENNINLVIPGPEDPLIKGAAREFAKIGVPCFGPSAEAASLEGSKVFAKQFMRRNNIPTADYKSFSDYESAKSYVEGVNHRVVVKASGLAGGKGVLIPETKEEAIDAVTKIMKDQAFGSAGDEIVIEEYLEGQELSIITISDGYTSVSFPPAQDHKRVFDNDEGPNTGGMGSYAPAPIASKQLIEEIESTVIKPSITAMRKEGFPFVGVLFTGLMITSTGPKVLEYNVRFGDPETETLLPLLSSQCDLAEIILAAVEHRLDSVNFQIKPLFCCNVVLTAGGYPDVYEKGNPITIADDLPDDTFVFHAGTKRDGSRLLTDGGRVINVAATAETIEQAISKAYEGVKCISFKDCHVRTDIGRRALDFCKEQQQRRPNQITYATSGVSIETGNSIVDRIKKIVKKTARKGANAEIGGFGGVFDLRSCGFTDPLLVAATDGVGTKLMLAQQLGKHNTVGVDLVAMNVNDLVVQGAEPLFFLDYFASGHLEEDDVVNFVTGIAHGCVGAGCALIGGETSEMPGMYPAGHYDVNGTAVGAVERNHILPLSSQLKSGDILLGLAADGVHSNGYSLVRKIFEQTQTDLHAPCPWDLNSTIGEFFLRPTRIYVKSVLAAIRNGHVKAAAHITGGGLIDNIPRVLPSDLNMQAQIKKGSWPILPCFNWLQSQGNVPEDDMYRTFNMGIGMVLIVAKEHVSDLCDILEKNGENCFEIGQLAEGPAPRGFSFI